MLHYRTIKPNTLEILKQIMNIAEFDKLNLAGGTSLALQIGHRHSFDLYFFGSIDFEMNKITSYLPFKNMQIVQESKHIFIVNIDGVKVDFVNFKYPLINNIHFEDNLRLLSLEDIAAMKLSAIAGRGKKRDFIDLYFLLKKYSLKELIEFYNKKFYDGSESLVLRSLTYFDDADKEDEMHLFAKVHCEVIKNNILQHCKNYFHF